MFILPLSHPFSLFLSSPPKVIQPPEISCLAQIPSLGITNFFKIQLKLGILVSEYVTSDLMT